MDRDMVFLVLCIIAIAVNGIRAVRILRQHLRDHREGRA